MKKSVLILLSFFVLLSTSGFSIVIKYCPVKKKTSISLDIKKSCCKKSGKKCCKNKKIEFKKIKDTVSENGQIKITDKTFSKDIFSQTQNSTNYIGNYKSSADVFHLKLMQVSIKSPCYVLYKSFLI